MNCIHCGQPITPDTRASSGYMALTVAPGGSLFLCPVHSERAADDDHDPLSHEHEAPAPDCAAVERAKSEILADIASGRVPASVATFSELHDHVDANEYGGLCESPWCPEDWDAETDAERDARQDAGSRVQGAVAAWMLSGGHMPPPPTPASPIDHLSLERGTQ